MEFSTFFIKTVLLLLPGLLAWKVYRQLVRRTQLKQWEDFLEILLFAFMAYLLYGVIITAITKFSDNDEIPALTIVDTVLDEASEINWNELLFVSIIGFVIAFVAAAGHNYKLLIRLGRILRVTRRFGDDDVWSFFHNMPSVEWVVVRDHKLHLIYHGWMYAYSDSGKPRELLLKKVQVWNNALEPILLYEVPILYLSRNKEDLTIEIPKIKGIQPERNAVNV